MSNIDKQALQAAAEKALQGKWDYEAGAIWNTDESGMVQHIAAVEAGDDISDEEHKSNMRFITLATPAVVLGLLDELYESKAAEANESSCANSVIDSAIKWQMRAKDAEAKLEAAEQESENWRTSFDNERFRADKLAAEMEARGKQIANDVQIKARLCRESNSLHDRLREAEKRNAEQADIIEKQEKWIKDIEATVITATDRAEAAEKRIAEQRETLLAARSHVMQCARLGDAHANGVLQAIGRAAAGKGEAL